MPSDARAEARFASSGQLKGWFAIQLRAIRATRTVVIPAQAGTTLRTGRRQCAGAAIGVRTVRAGRIVNNSSRPDST